MRRLACLLSIMSALCLSASVMFAQESRDKIYNHRIRKIGFYNIKVGGEISAWNNYTVAPFVSAGIGSFRNIANMDFGFRVSVTNPVGYGRQESVSTYSIPLFISGDLNFARFKNCSMYIGAEIDASFPIETVHFLHNLQRSLDNMNIGRFHLSGRGRLGVKSDRWVSGLFFEYDLAPSINQKIVYESEHFEFDTLKASIYERYRVGCFVSYSFNFLR